MHSNFKTFDFCGMKELCDKKEKGKGVFKDRKKSSGSCKTYAEAQQVDLFYAIAFFNMTNAKFPSSVLLFCHLFPYFLAITVVPTFAGTHKKKEEWTVTIDLSVQVPKLLKRTKLVCACMFEAL